MLACAYGAWTAAISLYDTAGWLALLLLAAPAATLHGSLRHEAIHGHPTASAPLNEALVFPALDLFFPYRRFKETHLRHHCDARLTDPYDDPESWYVAEADWTAASPAMRAALRVNATLLGRLVLGPWLAAAGLWRADLRDLRVNRARRGVILGAYARHAVGAALCLGAAWTLGGVDPLSYALLVAWPATALLMLRSFAEHRAAEAAAERTAVVRAEPLLALLFLNNNLHAAHHAYPRAPWWTLPGIWRRERATLLAQNGGYFINGYAEALRLWWRHPKEPVIHPILRRVDGPRPNAATLDRHDDRRAANVRLARTDLGDGRVLGRDRRGPARAWRRGADAS